MYKVNEPMPKVDFSTQETTITLIQWTFRAQPTLIPTLVGMFECHVGLGDDCQTAFDKVVKSYIEA